MIKGILFSFNVIFILIFMCGFWYGMKEKKKEVTLFGGSVVLILALNSLFILNS